MANYEVYDSEDSKFTPSVTSPDGQIKDYELVNKLYYPQLIIEANSMPKYRIQVLSSNLEPLKYLNKGNLSGRYFVYLKSAKRMVCLGMVHSDKLRALLTNDLYSANNKYIMLSETERIDGEMMLALCTLPNM